MIKLRPFQAELKQKIYTSWGSGHRNVLAVLPTGAGKCHGIDTPILMYDGTIKMVQDIRQHDILMGPDSLPRIVLSTTKGFDQLYRIIPVKGDSYVVNSQHVLSLKRTSEHQNDGRKGQIVNIPVRDFISSNNHFKHIHKGWRTGVDFRKTTLNFDPYMLGIWLGDGTSRTSDVTTPEPELIEFFKTFCASHQMKVRTSILPNNKAVTLCASKKDRTSMNKNYMGQFLHDNNLINNKHIPLIFKTASRHDRLELLAGILDTDGHYDGKSFDLIFKSEKLLDDTVFLCRSLGFSAYKSTQMKTCVNNGVTGVYHRISINGNLSEIPNRIPRKKSKDRTQKKDVQVTGIKVEDAGFGEYFGFQVFGTDHLYMLGDFTVTHNSVLVSDIILDGWQAGKMPQAVVAHRNELVTQMSCHIARRGIPHHIVGSDTTVSQANQKHREEFGQSFISPNAPIAVVGVDTLMARAPHLEKWAKQIHRWVIDESHHITGNDRIEPNKWGKAVKMFSNAYGLGVTATPVRADGQGLGRQYDGVMDDMVTGPSMRWLIENNYLCDYEIVCPSSDMQVSESDVSADGDWSSKTLRKAAKKSHIIGDVVQNYAKYAFGRRAIVFATDVETAGEIAQGFQKWGVRAEALSAKSLTSWRDQCLRKFFTGEIQVIVNVDLFDEGFDCGPCDVVIMARPTASLGKYLQMVGRALRYQPGKVALIIDHVSNVIRHMLPDKPRVWTLARRDKRGKQEIDPEMIGLQVCRQCTKPYDKFKFVCPYCGFEKPLPEPRSRSIEMVEGDLILLDRATLEKMRARMTLESAADVGKRVAAAAGPIAGKGAANRQMEKIAAHADLSEAIAQWAGIQRAQGLSDREISRKFYHTMGADVVSAMDASQDRKTLEALAQQVKGWYS